MIGFVIDDIYLVLPTGYRILMEYNNPAFTSVDEGSSSFPMDFPLTPETRQALQHAYSRSLRNKVIEFDAVQEVNKILLAKGKLILTQIVNETARGVFVVNGFNREVLNINLRDIAMGKEVLGDTSLEVATEAYDRTALDYPATAFNFPVHYNEVFYDGNNADFGAWINVKDDGGGSNLLRNTTTNDYTIVPWIFAQYVLEQIGIAIGFEIKGAFVADPDQQQLLVFSNVALDLIPTEIETHGTTTVSPQLIGGGGTTNPMILIENYSGSGWNVGASTFDYLQPGNYTVEVIIPCENPGLGGGAVYFRFRIVRVSDGLVAYENVDSVVFDPNPAVDEDITFTDSFDMPVSPDDAFFFSIKFFSDAGLTSVQSITIDNVDLMISNSGSVGLNIYNPVVDIASHLPNISVADFINGLCETFNLRVDYDMRQKRIELNYNETAYTSTKSRNVGQRYENNITQYIEQNGKKLEFAFTDAEKSRSHWRNNHKGGYTSGNGKTVVTPRAGALLQEHQPMPVSATTQSTLVPYLCDPGNSQDFQIESDLPYRLAYWYGRVNNASSNPYAFASSLNTNQAGAVIGNICIRLSMDDYCLIKLLHAKHLAAQALQEELEVKRELYLSEVLDVDFEEKQIIGNQEYLLKQRRLELGGTTIIATDRLIRVK